MYRCELCGITVPPRIRAHVMVIETRRKMYPPRPEAFEVVEHKDGKRKRVLKDDPGGQGEEIVHEALVCPTCAMSRS